MSEQATEPSVVEGCYLQWTPNGRCMTTVSFGGVIEAGLFIGECLGSVARVFLGSNSTKIVRSSPVPVLVIPRGADVRLQDAAPAARDFERER